LVVRVVFGFFGFFGRLLRMVGMLRMFGLLGVSGLIRNLIGMMGGFRVIWRRIICLSWQINGIRSEGIIRRHRGRALGQLRSPRSRRDFASGRWGEGCEGVSDSRAL